MSSKSLIPIKIDKKTYIIFGILLFVIIVTLCLRKMFTNMEHFGEEEDLAAIKDDVETIRSKLSSEYPDMSRYVQKSELPSAQCRVANAIDKDSYVSKTEYQSVSSKATGCDPEKYILKSAALQAQAPVSCPTLDPNQWILKSSLPPKEVCPPCIAPKVQVSAGLCKKCPPPPKCPEVKPCPVPECPKPLPCPPQKECPACPPKEECPAKICPACPPMPTEKVCPKCCDRDVIKVLKKTVYVDANGKEIGSKEEIVGGNKYNNNLIMSDASDTALLDQLPAYNSKPTPLPTDSAGSNGNNNSTPTPGSGLSSPSPTPTFSGSTSTGGSLLEQSLAGLVNNSLFSTPSNTPDVQSYKVSRRIIGPNGQPIGPDGKVYGANGQLLGFVRGNQIISLDGKVIGSVGADGKVIMGTGAKKCTSTAFNSEFQQYGIYGNGKNMYNDYFRV